MSTESKRNAKWNKLFSLPVTRFSQPFMISNDEFMVASSTDFNGIYKFNTQQNEWTKTFDYDKNFNCVTYSAAYDYKHKLLYTCDIYDWWCKMSTFDLKT
eukprot:468975_1